MARTLHQLTIFVSGPSGVDSEKAALRVIAEEISRRVEKTHAITLRIVGWPDDIRPGASTDIQAEINRQIGTDFDIYIGILGSRFGSPTTRSGSGTAEEFDAALSRFRADSTSVRVLFYFKRGGEDPFTLDLDQLQRVRQFRDGLGDRGVLYRDYTDTAEFTQRVREHLDALIIDEWRDGRWTEALPVVPPLPTASPSPVADPSAASTAVPTPIIDDATDDDELGVLEYMVAFHQAAEGIADVMNALTAETQRVGEKTSARSAEVDKVRQNFEEQKNIGGSRSQQHLAAETKATIDRAAEDLNEFVKAVVPRIEQYRAHNRALFENYRQAFLVSSELGPRDNTDDRRALVKLVASIVESREHVMNFQSSVSRLPGLTGRFKRSRRRTAAVLGELVAEMSFTMTEADVLLQEMGGEPEGCLTGAAPDGAAGARDDSQQR